MANTSIKINKVLYVYIFFKSVMLIDKHDTYFKVGDDKIIKHWSLDDGQLEPVDAVVTKVNFISLEINW